MVEAGQDLAFEAKALEEDIPEDLACHHLDGDALIELAVGAVGQVDCAHSALSDDALRLVRAEAAVAGGRCGWRGFEALLLLIGIQQRLHLERQRGRVGAVLGEPGGPFFRGHRQGGVEQLFDAPPLAGIGRHGDILLRLGIKVWLGGACRSGVTPAPGESGPVAAGSAAVRKNRHPPPARPASPSLRAAGLHTSAPLRLLRF